MTVLRDEVLKVCELAHAKKEGHIGSSLSILNILNAVFKAKSQVDLDFILSKGHASLGLFVILQKYGHIDSKALNSFCDFESNLGGHPDYRKVPGIKFSTGSLGHGFPQGIGLALAKRAIGNSISTIVLVGDGELNEGTNWEAALLACHHNLGRLKLIVDFNKSSERALSVKRVPAAFEALGWHVSRIDGHDELSVISEIFRDTSAPHLIWCDTIKGYGVSFMADNPEWHHKSPSSAELEEIRKELIDA
jgi:transketolase